MDKKIKRKMIILKILIIIMLLIFAEFFISNTFLSITKTVIKNEQIPSSFDDYKIVQLSDLHSRAFGKNNIRLIRAIERQQPDIIVLTGDMVNSSDTAFDIFYSLADELIKICPVYFIVGNHEQMLDGSLRKELIKEITSKGIIVLDNEKVTLDKNGDEIGLYGLWFNLRYYRNLNNTYETYSFTKDNMLKLLGEKSDAYTILLTHNPVYFESYSSWGADLTLSGHLHGGMIRIPFKGGLLSPEIKFFPEYDAGLYKKNNCLLYVSRGLGNGTFGIRFFNRPEIVVITLEKE